METDKLKRRTFRRLTLRITQLALASLPLAAAAQNAPAPACMRNSPWNGGATS